MNITVLFSMVIVLVFAFAMTNGFLDGGGIVSTVIATRALDPLPAILVVALAEASGLFVLGRAVAKTVGLKLFAFPVAASPEKVLWVLACAMASALAWNVIMWRASLPSSSSHALIGGLFGSAMIAFGPRAVRWPVALPVLIFLGVGPWLAAGTSFLLAKGLQAAGERLTPSVQPWLHKLHVLVSGGLALTHGSMDGQKSLGILWLAMAAFLPGAAGWRNAAPFLCAGGLTLGVILGSQRTMRTLGRGLYPMQAHQGLCAETAAMAWVGISSLLGWPMATSHVMSSAVLGAASASRPKGIRWETAVENAGAWIFTIPCAGGAAALLFKLVSRSFYVVP